MKNRVLYASGGLSGGPDGFWPIEPRSLKLNSYSFLALTKQQKTGCGVQYEG